MLDFYGFQMQEFLFEGRKATLVFPKESDKNRNWTLKTEYREAFIDIELELVKKGFHMAYLENKNRFATQEDCDTKRRFVEFLHREYGLREKCVPIGMSLGGAHAVNFAGFYPQCVACVFLDAPVLNFLSFPGGKNTESGVWDKEFVVAYPGITRAKLLDNFKYHPVNQAQKMMENNIPVIMLYGTEDQTVIYEENGMLLEEVYIGKSELLKVIPRKLQGHHPHGYLADRSPIFDFILKYAK